MAYCAIGASCASIPLREINTYLASELFERFGSIRKAIPTEADVARLAVDSLARDANSRAEIYEALLREVRKNAGDDYALYPDDVSTATGLVEQLTNTLSSIAMEPTGWRMSNDGLADPVEVKNRVREDHFVSAPVYQMKVKQILSEIRSVKDEAGSAKARLSAQIVDTPPGFRRGECQPNPSNRRAKNNLRICVCVCAGILCLFSMRTTVDIETQITTDERVSIHFEPKSLESGITCASCRWLDALGREASLERELTSSTTESEIFGRILLVTVTDGNGVRNTRVFWYP